MKPRQISLLLGSLLALLVLLLLAAAVLESLAPYRSSLLITAGIIGGGAIVTLIVFTRRQAKTIAASEHDAEAAFERTVMREMGTRTEGRSVAVREEQAPPPAPRFQEQIPAPVAEAQPVNSDINMLMQQLKLAGLSPLVEGQVQAGAFKGAAILRLGRDESALALTGIPDAKDWAGLFPRYDRVFIPQADGKWISMERIEGVIRRETQFAG